MAAKRTITIVAAPIGEAPLWVREAWIGLELPLAGESPLGSWPTVGVLTGPRSAFGRLWALLAGRTVPITGYLVAAEAALAVLDSREPQAAGWWRDHASHLFGARGVLIFDAACVRPPDENHPSGRWPDAAALL